MYRHHNFEERLNVVRRILCGEPIKLVCRSLSLDENLVRQWYLRYKKYGEEGLRGTRSYHYSAKEKAMIVKEYAEKGITLHEICLRYNLNRSTIKCQDIGHEVHRREVPYAMERRRFRLKHCAKSFAVAVQVIVVGQV